MAWFCFGRQDNKIETQGLQALIFPCEKTGYNWLSLTLK
jgi:hypothetical protein